MRVIYEPAEEPVTLETAKDYLRVDGTEDDDYITGAITAARRYCETFTGKSFITRTLEVVLTGFPSGGIPLEYPPVQAVQSFTYVDSDDTEHDVDEDIYRLDTYRGRLVLASGESWPSASLQSGEAVVIRYVAGYGDAEDVPYELHQAILFLVSHWYDQREPVVVGTIAANVPLTVDHLLWGYKEVAL
jgi:uncharacterized phiE125 gp8 family phage protein